MPEWPKLRKKKKEKCSSDSESDNFDEPFEGHDTFDTTKTTEYEVASITRSRVEKTLNGEYRTEFRVKWKGFKELTWEPMEFLADKCPLLFESLQKESAKKMRKSLHNATAAVPTKIPNFPQIPAKILSQFKDPIEFVPNGNEVVENIVHEICRNGSVIFWLVSFIGGPNLVYVRQCVMEYYFPTDSAFFHKVLEGKKLSMDHCLERLGKK